MYQKEYERKRITVEALLEQVSSDSFLALGSGPCTPDAFLSRLHELHGHISNLRATVGLTLAPYPVMTDGKYRGLLEQESMFYSPVQRMAEQLGQCSYLPTHLRSYPAVALRDHDTVDLLVTSVSPMDRHGYFTFCAASLIEPEALKRAKRVVVEVCRNAPRTFGDTAIHLSQIDALIECDRGLPVLTPDEPTETDLAIGRHVAALIEDGATIQLGIGAIPNAVARALLNKRDLGVHTEMLVDGVVDLIDAGVVTGRRKTLHPDKIVTCFTLGTQRLYDFIDDNPGVLHMNAAYTNNPYVLARNYKMTSVNTTLQMDLFGQCASETVGPRQYSGVGGQAETSMGAQMSPGGKAIMALRSTALLRGADGKSRPVSKLAATLDPGSVVSTSRADVEYVVTEFGVAELKGKTVRARAQALLSIAHPDFRDELARQAEELRLL